jgi:hypothetical protein
LTRLDVAVAGDALLKRTQALSHGRQHPRAVQTFLDQIPLLDRIVDEVERKRPPWFDIGPLVLLL